MQITLRCRSPKPFRLHPLARKLPMAMNRYSSTTELLGDFLRRSSLKDLEFDHGSDPRLDGRKTRQDRLHLDQAVVRFKAQIFQHRNLLSLVRERPCVVNQKALHNLACQSEK